MSLSINYNDIAGKFLTFYLGEEIYGIQILKVQEIIGMLKVTKMPEVPEFVRGIVNLRGNVIPVIDLRVKFGMEMKENTERTCIIVIQIHSEKSQIVTGFIVDEVSEVIDIGAEVIDAPPRFASEMNFRFILGIGKIMQKVILLLDTDKILHDEEMEILEISN